jgi:dipeptidyl aminopeptidase/acylaminoacyl peptidase
VTDHPAWVARYKASRVFLPSWAADAPDRSLYQSNASGRRELYAWDRAADTHRQVTDRRNGTSTGAIDPSGDWIWWFDDTDGDEWGCWVREPFAGGAPPEPALPGVPAGYQHGLAIGRTVAVVGVAGDSGSSVYAGQPGSPGSRLLYQHEQVAMVEALSRDDSLICLAHSERGDFMHRAIRVLRTADGSTAGELDDGPDRGLHPVGFNPAGGSAVLTLHERAGRMQPLVWDPVTGSEQEIGTGLDGDILASWYPDGTALLLTQLYAGRAELFRYQLDTGELTAVGTPRGTVSEATARPDGTVEFSWSSAASPPVIRSSTGAVVLAPPGDPAPPSVPVEDAWVEGPGGRVHAFVSCPTSVARPYPTVFLLHGGPHSLDTDQFNNSRAAYVDAGYCVVQVNYRGSVGYGTAWRDGLIGRPGLTELEDVAAVQDWAIHSGLSDADRCVIGGGSWGGYLTLLGLGTQPERWALGLAIVPVADYIAAYEDEMEGLKAMDRSLFGGTPEDVPEVYDRCSPLTYIERVQVPVLVLAGQNDARCPIRQIDNYLLRLEELDTPHEVYRFEAGHGSVVVEEQIRQMGRQLDFLSRHLPAGPVSMPTPGPRIAAG